MQHRNILNRKRVIGLALVAAMAGGCAGHNAYKRGIEAEKRGEAHLAYAYYAKAAQSNPDNASYDRALRRLGPLAAAHWVNDAKLARAEGRYDEAWKACMRALAIQPDRSEALSFYDDLERDYGAMLAGVKREWKKTGGKVLTIQVSPETPARRAELPESAPNSDAAPGGRRPRNAAAETASVDDAASATYLLRHALSRDADREVDSVDGVKIRLRSTTSDGTADFDLYEGDRRIQRIRDMAAGNSRLLLSPEGKWYRLTVIRVNHDDESSEIGLNPA